MEKTVNCVEALAQTSLVDCYQCGKCTAGCPVAERMDVMPNQIMRLVQLGQTDRAKLSKAIWTCVSCQTCSTRCPKNVDIAGVMDALRQLAYEQRTEHALAQRPAHFYEAFLNNIRRHGRVFELEMVGIFKTVAFLHDLNVPLFMQDSLLAPKLFVKGKLHVMPGGLKDKGVVDRIFQRCGVK